MSTMSTVLRRFPAFTVRTLLAPLGVLLILAGEGPAAAQCTLLSGPTALPCAGCTGNLGLYAKTIPNVYQSGGQYRLGVMLNYGHAVYSLADPGNPSWIGLDDIRTDNPGPGPMPGDGQTYLSGLQISTDGAFALETTDVTGVGGTVVGKPNTQGIFKPAGDTGVWRSIGGLVIQKSGSRYIGYGLGSALWAADITNAVNYAMGSVTWEHASFEGIVGSSAGSLQLAEGNGYQYLTVQGGQTFYVVDASSPGPSGSITTSYPNWAIQASEWGQPSGDKLFYAQAAVDPRNPGNLYIAAEFKHSGVPYFALLYWNRTTDVRTPAGTFTPDPAFTIAQVTGGVVAVPNSYTSDVDVYMWARSATGGANGTGILRLYATSAGSFGTAIGQTVDISIPPSGQTGLTSVVDTRIFRTSDSDVYAYVTNGFVPWAMHMDCANGPAPAVGHLAVSNTSAGGTQLASGATVFVGDTLMVTPSVSPANIVQPVTAWDLDFDYHSGSETGSIGLLQIKFPDACLSGCSATGTTYPSAPDPPQFALVGPCDPQHGGSPNYGTNCWSSVVAVGDFTSQPAAGTTKKLPVAFEAQNALNDTTVPLATFDIFWKVPAVKVQNTSSLLTGGNAQFTSGSEGHPTSYKWYFGSVPGTGGNPPPSGETLTLASCTGPSCTYPFAQNGTYNAWLTAYYDGGYSSPDCGSPCTLPKAGSFIVNVTDFVPAFTADSSAYIGGNGIHVSNQSNSPTYKSSATYLYYLCDATSGPCSDSPAGYSQLQPVGQGPWVIPTPSPSGNGPWTYWLRIKATYGSGPSTAQWQPNVSGVSDAKAWPITVSAVPPYLQPTAGASLCTVGCSGVVYLGTTGTQITVAAFQGSTQLTGSYQWSTSGASANPSSGTGATFNFTPTAAGNLTVTNDLPASLSFIISAPPPPPPPPPTNLSVSVTANPTSTTVGTNVSLQASASGGSGTYNNYYWQFGDGGTYQSQYPSISHPYASAGTFHPTCTVTDSQGNSGSDSATVTVTSSAGPGGSLAVTVAASPSSTTVGITVAFSATASGGSGTYSTYSWNFGDGSAPLSGLYPSASHVYSQAGTYIATCTVSDSLGGSITGQTTVTVASANVPPDFRITYPDGTDAVLGSDGSFLVAIGQENSFRAVSAANPRQTLSVASPYWNWGDGTAGPSMTPVEKTWTVGGTYPVTLTVAGQPTAFHNVNVVGGIPTAAYSFVYSNYGQPGGPVNPNDVRPGTGILFTSTGPPGAAYFWDFGDGTPCGPSTPASDMCRLPVTAHAYATPGNYTASLTVQLGGNTFSTPSPTTFNVALPPQWIVPGLAYRSGTATGSLYASDVVIQNPCVSASCTDGWAGYSVALLDGTNPPNWISLPYFQPGESRRISNVLATVFGKSAGGPTDPSIAMVVRGDILPPGADPVIWGFTYDSESGKGTYGDAIPAVPISRAVGPGSAWADREYPGLRDMPVGNSLNVSPAYTNVGLVNTSDVSATVKISFYDRSLVGPIALGGTFGVFVPPYQTVELQQALRNALALVGTPYDTYEAPNYWMLAEVVGDGARIVPYATITDVGSTDTTVLTAVPNVTGRIRMPDVFRNVDTGGQGLKTRVVVFNTSGQSRPVNFTLSYVQCPGGGTCGPRLTMTVTATVPSGYTIVTDDLVQFWFQALGLQVNDADVFKWAYLDAEPADGNTDPLITRSETYDATQGGSFGRHLPGLVPSLQGATAGGAKTRLTIPFVVPASGGSGFNTTLGLVSLGDVPAQFTARLRQPFQGAGYPVPPVKVVPLGDMFVEGPLEALFPELATFPQIPNGYYSLEITVTSGSLAAYARINDSTSGDGKLILAKPLPPSP